MSEVKLLPCPFCGHAPQDWPDFLHPTGSGWRDDPIGDGTTFRHYMRADDPRGVHGRCWELGCLTHEGGCGATVVGDSRDEAIAAWNRRATAARDAENERLRAQYQRAAESSEHFAARAERLEEALRWIAGDDTAKGCDDGMQEVEAIKQRARAALDQEGGNG